MVMFGIKWKWQTLKTILNLVLGPLDVWGIWDVEMTLGSKFFKEYQNNGWNWWNLKL
jgi:hypothetical protein